MAELAILNPIAHISASKSSLAPRLSTLENKQIGLYWNSHVGGDVALVRVSQLLESRFSGARFKLIRSGVPGSKDRVEEAKAFDGVIGAIAD